MKNLKWLAVMVTLLLFVSCRAEVQNQFRRQVLDVANAKMYIVVYSLTGNEVMRGIVDGKVTRAEAGVGNGQGGEYVYWFDEKGKYYQTSLPYIVTNDPERSSVFTHPPTGTMVK